MFGVEAEQLDKAQLQAGMMSVTLEKLEQNTAAMPEVTESAAAKMARLQATFQDFKDDLGAAFLPALVTLMDTLSQLANAVMPALIPFVDAFAASFQTVLSVLNPCCHAVRWDAVVTLFIGGDKRCFDVFRRSGLRRSREHASILTFGGEMIISLVRSAATTGDGQRKQIPSR